MKTSRPPNRHLDSRTALDYLEFTMDAARRRAVQEHLAGPCRPCHELICELGWLVERMRRDRAVEVPETVRLRALAVFERPPAPERTSVSVATLLFDSWSHSIPAAASRAAGDMRRLRFALGSDVLELESEAESSDFRTLRGRLHAPDPLIHRVEVVVGDERLSTHPDAAGAFVFDGVPMGRAYLTVTGPQLRYKLPPVE